MRLLRILPTLDPEHGGVVAGATQIIPALTKYGVESHLLCLDSPSSSFLSDYPYPVYPLGPSLGKYCFKAGLISRMREIIQDFDAVIIDGIWQFHSLAAWRSLKSENKPFYVFTHGMLDPWFKRAYPLKHIKKWAYWPWADYRVLRDAKAVLFTTEQERLLARHSFWLYKANEVVVGFGALAPPPYPDQQHIAFIKRFPHLRGKRILLFLSRIHPKKGVDLLIKAFSAVAPTDPDLHLVIAGPDQVHLQPSLQRLSVDLDIADRITWPGMLHGELKWGAFRSAELFCLPSHQENFGIVVAEALACGLPVAIAEPVNIAAEVAAAGAGLVHHDTVDGTIRALRQWLVLKPGEKERMAARAASLFSAQFDFDSVAKSLVKVLN